MDELAQTVLMHLKRSSTPVDAKLTKFNELKSNIKHQRVPEAAQPIIFDCIKFAIGSQTSSSLISSGFSALGHLIKRLTLQNQDSAISSNAGRLFPALLDRLGDARESHRNAASQTIQELEPYCAIDVERLIRDTALVGTNARAKEAGMQWVVKMSQNGLAFKTYVPKLVANLEDPDGGVRDVAKTSIVELFRDAPDHAKSDLKKQMSKFAVRSSIVSGIVAQLGMGGQAEPAELHASTASVATHSSHSSSIYSHLQPDTGIAETLMSASVTSEAPSTSSDYQMEPAYAHTQRELEDMFRSMAPCFEGKESEGNWMQRDKNVMQIRRLNKGNSPSDYLPTFLAGVKSLLDGILKVANSLRTTMSTNGCQCIQELAKTLGPAMDNMVEILLQSFIKMTAATKKIAANNANTTVDVLFQNVSYNNRNLQHVWQACQDKNVQPRNFASGWLKTIIKKHAPHRSVFEHAGGLETVENCLKKGLQDPTPAVREGMRATYWIFAPVWPSKAVALKDGLEKKYKDALEKDPRNPNAPASANQSASFSKSVGPSGSRPNIRDAIAQQRKAAAQKLNAPDRPNSAMSTFSPAKVSSKGPDRTPSSLSNSRTARTTSTNSSSSTNTRPANRSQTTATATPGASGASGLMSAPMRRPRPPPRPATADPYASRRIKDTDTPNLSPTATPIRDTTTKKSANTKSAIRPRTPANTNRPSPTTSPSKVKAKVDSGLRRKVPNTESPQRHHGSSQNASPSKVDEEMTLVLPHGKMPASVARKRMEKPMSMDTGLMRAEEEELTIVKSDMMSHGSRLGTPGTMASPRGPYAQLNFGSPASSSRTPRRRSPERNTEKEQEEVKVYEDPFIGHEDAPMTEDEKPVLEELQLNEANIERSLDNATAMEDLSNGHVSNPKPILTEQDRAEVMRSRRLLVSGIERIHNRNLDAHGFRRLQELVKSNLDIWGESKFSELMLGLLDFLETPVENLKSEPLKAQNLKTQALAAARAMLTLHKAEARPYHPRALKSVLRARMAFEATAHITAELQRTADDIVRASLSPELLDSVLDFADSTAEASKSPENEVPGGLSPPLAPSEFPSRALTAALSTISQILILSAQPAPRPKSPVKSASRSPSKPAPRLTLSYTQTQRLGHTAVRFLADAEPDVRKANLEFCVALHEWFLNGAGVGGLSGASEKEREEAFWKILGLHKDGDGKEKNGVRDQSLNLITYYLARRSRT
ncbi:hypothetical protein EJ05DRAFT_462711 [Pseudovirgaria hyperparasitica]|uniref:TOG domain-containing protein n=1 Tax=Pseudovirgaria hyperparasitica TaxID=470096 RepID=A0A6A6WDH7_9PEZI|nr:uncharacterized protein EJ05DRAFT_462711 [Pseudovirgaria hyperparasitica]KAF2760625.1 hypothetical protein EJ05DRAFT_462711 [Pseudovirgaria hyperparasitica]